MPSTSAAPSELIDEIGRIRELSKNGRHSEALAAAQAFTQAAPLSRDAAYLVAANQRCLNRIGEALATLQRLERQHPRFSLLFQERGYCYTTLRDAEKAIKAFSQAVNLNPALVASWNMLAHLYRLTGNSKGAAFVAEQISVLERLPPEVLQAGKLFSDGELPAAEKVLRSYLLDGGKHVEAMRLLARIEHKSNALADAERRLEAALGLAPNYRAARLDYVQVLLDQQKYLQAYEVIGALLADDPANHDLVLLSATACAGLGKQETAIGVYQQLLAVSSESPELHLALGHSFQSVGRRREAVEAYRMAARIRPSFGDAYWSLANLKTYRFRDEDLALMHAEEAAHGADDVDRYHLCFALGKAYEDRNEYGESWRFYERGNALKRAEIHYSPSTTEACTRKQIEVCTAEFFSARAGAGSSQSDPIFIVGLPRSGSTLIEQILASHSLVDGTQELPNIPRIVRELEGLCSDPEIPHYSGAVANLAPEHLRLLGDRYVTETRAYRGRKPFFIDKMPNNFRHIGLIHLILPNAKIIDVRREPMACCFSNFKQLFASGQEFSYSIDDIARYYRSYLELVRHWDSVLPGRVLRVFYEDVVDDLTVNVRRILEYCGLEFEAICTEFHRLKRNIHTASSEQVRRPIFREGLQQWRNYEPWLGLLKNSLGDALICYRE